MPHNPDEKCFTEIEFRDALRSLEEENVVSLTGHSSQPNIRLVK